MVAIPQQWRCGHPTDLAADTQGCLGAGTPGCLLSGLAFLRSGQLLSCPETLPSSCFHCLLVFLMT